MKTKSFFLTMSVVVCTMLVIGFTGCKSKKVVPKGEEAIEFPCSGPEFFTKKGIIRATAMGESEDQMIAKKKAQANSREQLAATLSLTIKSVVDNYYSSRTVSNLEQAKTRFEGLTRQVVEQQLSGVATICEKFTKTKQNTYKCYIAQEVNGEEIMKGIQNKISNEDKLRLDFEYEKFRSEFNKELEKNSK
ncbi:MAG: hypothetical protein LWW85_06355 [Marinilabiliales bacterium]|nr:hypothetical protein [Marinilabiliales bacterium]